MMRFHKIKIMINPLSSKELKKFNPCKNTKELTAGTIESGIKKALIFTVLV